MTTDLEESERAFAYWREWLKDNRAKLATLRSMMRTFNTATRALAGTDEQDVKRRFAAFRTAFSGLRRCIDRIDTHAWLPENYEPPRATQYGHRGAPLEERAHPNTDVYYVTAWLNENGTALADARSATTEVEAQLDSLKRIRAGTLPLRAAQFAWAVEDLRFQMARINPEGWIPEGWGKPADLGH